MLENPIKNNLKQQYIVKKITRFRFERVRTGFKKFLKYVNQNRTTYLKARTEPEPEPNLGPVRRFGRFWTGSEPNFGIPSLLAFVGYHGPAFADVVGLGWPGLAVVGLD
jgi:hypothetical protein